MEQQRTLRNQIVIFKALRKREVSNDSFCRHLPGDTPVYSCHTWGQDSAAMLGQCQSCAQLVLDKYLTIVQPCLYSTLLRTKCLPPVHRKSQLWRRERRVSSPLPSPPLLPHHLRQRHHQLLHPPQVRSGASSGFSHALELLLPQ
jgi:hypothetical protein